MEKTTLTHYIKILFTLLLIVFASVLAVKELYFNSEIALIPAQSQVLAASTFTPLEGSLAATPKNIREQVATISAKPLEQTDHQVNLPILMYHHIRDVLLVTDRSDIEFSVTPASLNEQLSFLHNEGYQTLGLNDLNDSLENGTPLPPKSVILTFDDGFRDFYTSAFPILKKYNLRAVMFYVAGYTNFPGYMDQQMLLEIHNSGLVDVEGHTMTHQILVNQKPADLQREVVESKTLIESLLNKKINYFAYPYGAFDQNVINAVNLAGYRLAFGTTPGTVLKQSQKYSLPRIGITGFDNLDRFKQKLGVNEKIKEENQTLNQNIEKLETKETSVSAEIKK